MSSILVVDDEKSIRDSLCVAFEEQGYAIDLAENGEHALSFLHDKKYDLVLTDLRMPQLDGIKLLESIREEWGNSIPVILISAYVSTELSALVRKAGAYDIINKPFSLQRINKIVNQALQTKGAKPEEISPQSDKVTNEIQKKILELSAMDKIQQKIRALSDNSEIFNTLLQYLQNLFDLDYGIFALYGFDGKEYVVERYLSEQSPLKLPHHMMLDNRLLPSVARAHRPYLVDRIDQNSVFRQQFKINQGSLLAVPFHTDCALQGGLLLYRRESERGFDFETVRFLSLLMNYLGVKIENNERGTRLNGYFTDTVQAMFATLEAKDPHTYAHSAKVACYALLIARQLNLPENEFHNLEYLALLHDIGKIALPNYLLSKDDLTDEEYELWKSHPAVGEAIIRPIQFIAGGDKVIRHHHEHYDGTGFPDGLKGEKIPLFSRVIMIANDFANLTEKHEYQDRQAQKKMVESMMCQAGKKYDPQMLKLFLKAYCNVVMADKKAVSPPEGNPAAA